MSSPTFSASAKTATLRKRLRPTRLDIQMIFVGARASSKSVRRLQGSLTFSAASDAEASVDYEHYLALQVLPPIERLCDPIEGTDRARIAECLGKPFSSPVDATRSPLTFNMSGLDSSRFQQQSIAAETEREFSTLDSQISDAERFRDVEPLRLKCRHCGSDGVFGGLLDDPVRDVCRRHILYK